MLPGEPCGARGPKVGPGGRVGQGERGDDGATTRQQLDELPRPFGSTVVTPWHVERPETARVLAELDRRVVQARQTGALVGPPGLGRTHLARVLSERTDPSRLQCVYLPHARFDFTDLCRVCVAWATGRRRVPEPEGALRQLLRDVWGQGRSLFVVLDDADAMPSATAEAWLELTFQQVPSLITLFVMRDDAAPTWLEGLVQDAAPIVRFDAPMSEHETCEYVVDRLARVGARPKTLERFSEDVVERLHALSGGWPVRLHALAQLYLDLPEVAPEHVSAWLERLATIAADPGTAPAPAGPVAADRLIA